MQVEWIRGQSGLAALVDGEVTSPHKRVARGRGQMWFISEPRSKSLRELAIFCEVAQGRHAGSGCAPLEVRPARVPKSPFAGSDFDAPCAPRSRGPHALRRCLEIAVSCTGVNKCATFRASWRFRLNSEKGSPYDVNRWVLTVRYALHELKILALPRCGSRLLRARLQL